MRKLLFILACLCASAFAQNLAVNGDCTVGGQAVVVQNLKEKGTTPIAPGGPIAPNSGVMASYPGCTVSVFATGTTNTVPLFSNASGSSPLPDPFTANTTTGQWLFYVATGTYDVMVSGAGIPSPRIWTAIQPGGGGGGGGGAFLPLAGGTMLGEEITAPSTAANAGFNLPNGTAPNVCVNGDLWTTSVGLFECNNGVAVGPFGTGSGTVTSVGLTVPTGFSVSNSPITGSGTLNMVTSGLTSNRLIKAVTGGLGDSLFSDNGTNGTYTGTGGLFSPIITTTGACPGAGTAVGCFDVGVGTPAPNNPPVGFDRFYGDSITGNVLCKTTSGAPCFASGQNITASAPIVVTPSPLTGAGTISCPTCGTGSGNFSATGTNNIVVKFTGANTGGNSSITDDGTAPTRTPNGANVASSGANSEYPNNAVTGTSVNKLVCDDGSGKGILCSHLTSVTNIPLGVCVSGCGTTGSATICSQFWCSVISDNQTVAKDWLISSSTVDGEVHDTGSALETAGQPNIFNYSANAGIGTATSVRFYTPDSQSTQANCPTCVTAISTLTNHAPVISTGARGVKTTAAGSAGQILASNGASADAAYLTFPDTKSIPFAACVNGTAATGVSTTTAVGGTCRAGTNNKDAFIGPFTTSDSATFKIHIPKDADLTTTLPYIDVDLASTDATNGHTVILQESIECAKLDGSTTDDVAFNAARSMATVTLNGNANRTWNTTLQLNSTDLTGCSAPGIMWVKITRTTDTATNVELYQGATTIMRFLVPQAN